MISILKKLKAWFDTTIRPRLTEERMSQIGLGVTCALLIWMYGPKPSSQLLSPVLFLNNNTVEKRAQRSDKTYEVFGFAPYWTLNNLQNIDYDTLTTLAYFDAPIDADGNVVKDSPGYQSFKSAQATSIFRKAHQHGTRVVLTITQMDQASIRAFIMSDEAQKNTIAQVIPLIQRRGIDGVNIDFEYLGDPGQEYRSRFTTFVQNFTNAMHKADPDSKVSVSVIASAVKDPKIYDIGGLAKASDNIFMMAYDYATTGSDTAMPTAPLYGYKEGKYWYDVSTAVDDFLTYMPANKLILGVPYYGYNYVVNKPQVQADTAPYWSWKGQPATQTYSIIQNYVTAGMQGVADFINGWDDVGKVGYKAYYLPEVGAWRMVFVEDSNSLGLKYDFAKSKKLAGVGMWALGFDEGKPELWNLLKQKFGEKLADNRIYINKVLREDI